MKKIKRLCKLLPITLLFMVLSVGVAFANNLKNNPINEGDSQWGEKYLTGTTFSLANDDSQTDKSYFLLSDVIFGRPLATIEMGPKYQEAKGNWNAGGSVTSPRFTILSNPALLESSYLERTDNVNRLIFATPQNGETIFKITVGCYKPNSDFALNFNIEEIAGGDDSEITVYINGKTISNSIISVQSKKQKSVSVYSSNISESQLLIEVKRSGASGDNAVIAISDLYVYGETEMFSISANETSVGLGSPVTINAFSAVEMDFNAVKWEKNINGAGFVPFTDASGNQLTGASVTDTPEAGQTCYRAMVMVDGTKTYSNEVCVDAEYKCATNSAYSIFTDDFGKLSSETARANNQYVGNKYTYVGDCGMLQAEGTYAVVANARYGGCNKDGVNDGCGCTNATKDEMWFRDIYDHTQDGMDYEGNYGGMLLVNADAQLVYSRKVNLPCANTNLIFSAWFATASNKATASVRFFVVNSKGEEIKEATLVLEGDDIAFDKGWVKGETSFYTGEETDFTVEIHSYNASGQGNDFLIDDISFSICVPEISLSVSSTVPEVQVKEDMVSGSCGSAINLDLEEGMAGVVFKNPYYLWYVKEQGSNEFVHKAEFDNKTSIDTQITPYTQYYVVATANEAEAQEYIAGNLPKCTPVAISNTITVLCSPNLEVELKERNCNEITLKATKYDDPSNYVKFWWQISNDGKRWTNLNVPTNAEVINYTITADSYFRINSELAASPAVKVSLRGITLTSNPTKTYIGEDVKLTASTIKYELGEDDKYEWFEKDLTDGIYNLLEETENSFLVYTLENEKATIKVVAEGCEAEVTIEELEPLKIAQKSRDCNEVTIEGITDLEPSKIKWYYSLDGTEYSVYSQVGTPIIFNVSEENKDGVYIKGKTTDGKVSDPIVVYPIVIENKVYDASNVEFTDALRVYSDEQVTIKTEISGIQFASSDVVIYKSCDGSILSSASDAEFTTNITKENKCFITEYKGCVSENIEFSIKPQELIWPTAFNPLNQDGINDTFVKGYGIKVMIMDRYGNVVAESEDGWDGTIKGANAMPGVYYYVATLPDETIKKGTIELVHYVK